jgi:hypothetical protein
VRYPAKPAMFNACNGCGICCIATPCPIALDVDPEMKAPCGFLEWEDGRFWCGLVRRPSRHISGDKDRPMIDAVVGAMILSALGDGLCDGEGADGMTAPEFLASEGL